MSLEPALEAIRLAGLLRDLDVQFDIASSSEVVSLIRAGLDEAEVIVADLPPLLDNLDPGRLMKTLKLLEAFRPDETHLVMPSGVTAMPCDSLPPNMYFALPGGNWGSAIRLISWCVAKSTTANPLKSES